MAETESNLILFNAIENKLEITFSYNNIDVIMRPYLIGLSIMNDPFLFGEVLHDEIDHFYRFELDKVISITISEVKFKPITKYKVPDFTLEIYSK